MNNTLLSEALSPWGMKRAERAVIHPISEAFDVSIKVPGSKSYTNRALAIGAVAKGRTRLFSPLFGDDSYWCVNALQSLGAGISANLDEGFIDLAGDLPDAPLTQGDARAYIGSAGTVARFLPGLIAARANGKVRLVSSEQMARRPIDDLVRSLRDLGAEITTLAGRSFPMDIEGGSLVGGRTKVRGDVSSQFLSGILMAAPLAREPVEIELGDELVQPDYIKITIDIMKNFGVSVDHDDGFRMFRVEPADYVGRDYVVEADASTATYFLALGAVTASRVHITNLNPNSFQPDIAFAASLEKMGCAVSRGNPTGVTVDARQSKLRGGLKFDFSDNSDSTPALVAVSPYADGPIEVRGVAHIRTHECDRLAVLRQGLTDVGIPCKEFEDGLIIGQIPRNAHKPISFDPHDDHRMAMSMSVLMAGGAGGSILDPSCVSKTCPPFFDILKKDFGADIEIG